MSTTSIMNEVNVPPRTTEAAATADTGTTTGTSSSSSTGTSQSRIQSLESLVQQLQEENRQLRLLLQRVNGTETCEEDTSVSAPRKRSHLVATTAERNDTMAKLPNDSSYTQQTLDNDTIQRYSRQMLIIGVKGQQKLQRSSVLVIGAGGIGSTVLYYLAGAGVGTIDVMDHDVVEVSNLHRQIIHTQPGIHKAISAQQSLLRFNPMIRCNAICEQLSTQNAMKYVQNYDVIVDATDNVTSRYIINDACVLLKKPLISGSAITTQGQLTVYTNNSNISNHNVIGGSENLSCCYRCMYPNQAVQNECQSCNDAGVLGPVPGLIGILQAVETIKLLTSAAAAAAAAAAGGGGAGAGAANTSITNLHDKLLMYDGMSASFMTITKPKKNPSCPVCGSHPTITSMDDTHHDLQRTVVCPLPQSINHFTEYDISCIDYYNTILHCNVPHILLDVRVRTQYDICSLSNSTNIPLEEIFREDTKEYIGTKLSRHNVIPIYCICRRGIASREAVRILHEEYHNATASVSTNILDGANHEENGEPKIYNIVGGLVAWQQQVDPTFPTY